MHMYERLREISNALAEINVAITQRSSAEGTAPLVMEAIERWKELRLQVDRLDTNYPDPREVSALEAGILELRGILGTRPKQAGLSAEQTRAIRFTAVLTLVLVAVAGIYVVLHDDSPTDAYLFEPWGLVGPMKYLEIACWSIFGVLSTMIVRGAIAIREEDLGPSDPFSLAFPVIVTPFFAFVVSVPLVELGEIVPDGWLHDLNAGDGKFYLLAVVGFALGFLHTRTAAIATRRLHWIVDKYDLIKRNVRLIYNDPSKKLVDMPKVRMALNEVQAIVRALPDCSLADIELADGNHLTFFNSRDGLIDAGLGSDGMQSGMVARKLPATTAKSLLEAAFRTSRLSEVEKVAPKWEMLPK